MENYVILGVVAVIILIALRSAAKHMKGQGSCCGGGSGYTPRKKKLKTVIATKTFRVEGMHCEKCSGRVTEVVNDIPGVAGVVNLKKGTLTVSYEQEVADEVLRARLDRVGYTLLTD